MIKIPQIKNSIKVLKEHAPEKVESLMNALRLSFHVIVAINRLHSFNNTFRLIHQFFLAYEFRTRHDIIVTKKWFLSLDSL